MTISLIRGTDRTHVSRRNGERWSTFSPGDPRKTRHFGFDVFESLVEQDLPPGMGFLAHPFGDHEMVTYVEEGAVTHEDPAGRTRPISAGEFRNDPAPRGATHGAVNRSRTEHAHVFQGCLVSHHDPRLPRPGQKSFSRAHRKGRFTLVASPDGRDGSLGLHVDVRMYSSLPLPGTHLIHPLQAGRRGWLHVVAGRIQLRELTLMTGDGAGFVNELAVSFSASIPSEILLFDLP